MISARLGLASSALILFVAATASASTIQVPASGDLQAALDRAQPGDVVTLQPGAIYTGNFTLAAKSGGSAYIVVRSAVDDAQLPAPGMRMTAAAAARVPLARIQSPTVDAAVKTAAGAHHWQLLAVEVVGGPAGGDIVRLGDGSSTQHDLASVPHDLVIDRCYIHGTAASTQKRGVALNSASTSVINSWISEIKAVDQDSQAIAGWNGPGPFNITNNYLEAAGENFLLGGADPAISGLVPTGVTFRDNWVRKPIAWRGSSYQVKNLLELKNARAVVIENNLFENNWQAAQPGYAVLFTPRNQDGQSPWSTVQDVTFRANVVRHVADGINILGHDSPNPSQQAVGITITGNVLYDVNGQNWGGDGIFLQIGDGPAGVVVEHNTVLQSGTLLTAYGGSASSPLKVTGFVFRDNLVMHNQYGVKGDSAGVGNATLAAYFPGAVFTGNIIAGGQASQYPPGNQFPSVSQVYAQFVNASADNYQLTASSAYVKASTDGTAVGADVQHLAAILAFVTSSTQTGRPRPANAPTTGQAKPRIGGN